MDAVTPLSPADFPSIVAHLLTGNLAIGLAYIDKDGVVRFSNAAHQEFVRPGGPPFVGERLQDVLPPERWEAAKPFVSVALSGTAVSYETSILTAAGGGPAYLQVSLLPHAATAPHPGQSGVDGMVVLVEDVTRRRRAEAALQASEATLRAVFESASQAIIAVEAGGGIRFHNRMAEQMFGYATEQLVGQPIEQLIPARFASGHAAHRHGYFSHPRSRGMGTGMELVALRADGSDFPVEVSLSHVNSGGQALAIAFVSDVSQRKRLEEERNQFFNLSADLNCVAGLDGYFKQVNQSFHRVLGWTDEEIMARQFADFVHPDDRAAVERELARLAAGLPVQQFVNRYRCRDGSYRWLSWTAPAPSPSHTLVYAAARDVTDDRKSQAERERLVTLIQNSSDWTSLLAPTGEILFLNNAGCRMAGYASFEVAQAAGLKLADLFDAGPMLAAVSEGERWRGEVSVRNRVTGEVVPLDVTAFSVHAGDEPVWALVAHDIRRRKRDRERLQALTAQLLNVQEEERRRIARDLHDDITQKLAMLGIEFGLIQQDVAAADPACGERLSALQEQILRLSEDVRQLSHQLHPSVLEHSGLGPALDAFCREMGKQTGIDIRVVSRSVPASLPQPVAVGLYRIAQEALRNVSKHAGARSASLTLTGDGHAVRLTVIDDGRGFDAAVMESQPGIGMVSMQERARLIDARLSIDSQPGEGTRITVEAPLPAQPTA